MPTLKQICERQIEEFDNLFGFDNKEGTYWHILTRVKEARQIGTLTIDDFKEINEEDLEPLKSYLQSCQQELLKEITTKIKEKEELHRHNSIPGYTDDLDEGCSICIKNQVLEDLIKELNNAN